MKKYATPQFHPLQASTAAVDAARSVQSLGTTASTPEWLANPEWVEELEYVWSSRTSEARDRHEKISKQRYKEARAIELAARPDLPDPAPDRPGVRVGLMRSAEWHGNRARAIAMRRADVIGTCRKRWRQVACGCGWKDVQVGCDAPTLCDWCRKKHWRKWRSRITRSMATHLRAARAAWNVHRRGMLPGVYLITLTGPHTGDLELDRKRMGKAWRELTKAAHAGRWWGAYALTWEATPGADGRGHMHAHVAVVSSWVPYDELHEAWARVMPGARVLDVQAPNRKRNEAGSAANYLAKYVTKGVNPAEMTGRKAGEMLCAFRGRRKVTTSAHFWMRRESACPTCKLRHRLVGAPCSLQDLAPGAVVRSLVARCASSRPIQDVLFMPWEWRAPLRPSVPVEKTDKRNGASQWAAIVERWRIKRSMESV